METGGRNGDAGLRFIDSLTGGVLSAAPGPPGRLAERRGARKRASALRDAVRVLTKHQGVGSIHSFILAEIVEEIHLAPGVGGGLTCLAGWVPFFFLPLSVPPLLEDLIGTR